MESDIPNPSYKVVVLGDSSVGKTSLVHRFTTDQFNTSLANTIGAAFITKDYDSKTSERTIRFEIWDTAGQERYRSLTPMYYRNSRVALVCYDLTDIEDSFPKGKYWIDQLKLNNDSSDEDNIRIILVGTKSDLAGPVNSRIVNEFIEANSDIDHFVTSSKTGEGVTLIFDNIIDKIPQQFFTDYYQKLEEEEANKSQSINFLNNQFTSSTNKCC